MINTDRENAVFPSKFARSDITLSLQRNDAAIKHHAAQHDMMSLMVLHNYHYTIGSIFTFESAYFR
jgi:hypothetical protein